MLPSSRSAGHQVKVLENVPCHLGIGGCDGTEGRGWKLGSGPGWEALEEITDASGASWIDIDDDVSDLSTCPVQTVITFTVIFWL
jgi:integrin alpha FG-GAP repeat containing protein 1